MENFWGERCRLTGVTSVNLFMRPFMTGPPQLEKDKSPELVAGLSPPVRDKRDDLQTPPVLRQARKAPDRGRGVGAVVANFYAQRAQAAVERDLEGPAVS
jgi:hypothetical protein